jgi:hypothetical protein
MRLSSYELTIKHNKKQIENVDRTNRHGAASI